MQETPDADNGAQVIQLTQVQRAQVVSSAVSQALTQHVQQIGSNPPPSTAPNHVPQTTTTVQQIQSLVKFDVPVFESDSAASWLMWSQRVVYQARACGFDYELTAVEGEGMSVGAGVFYRSNVDPVRLRNAHIARITLINSCRGMALTQNLKSQYRVKGTRGTLRRWNQGVTHSNS